MSKYTGAQCPVCEKVFVDGDDVVVCPECGAPHHRECYLKEGHCHFESTHGSGETWKRPTDYKKATGEDILKCPKCSAPNSSDRIFCDVCGERLDNHTSQNAPRNASEFGPPPIAPNPYTTPFGGIDPVDTIKGIPVKDWAMFVGDRSFYFLPRFKIMESHPLFFNTNWAAFFANFFYYFYRKMYLIGAALLALLLVSYAPMLKVIFEFLQELYATGGAEALAAIDLNRFMDFAQQYEGLLMFSATIRNIAMFASAILSLFANKLYFMNCEKKIKRLREQFKDDDDYNASLARHGRTSKFAIAAILVMFFVAIVFIPNLFLMILM